MPLPRAKRRLGQHFLTDPRVVLRQVAYARLSGNETVLEIGPGPGILTRALAAAARRVVAIEIDRDLAAALAADAPKNVEVVVGDAVEAPFPEFDLCVSNLPYNVSTPIAFRLLEAGKPAILMFQKEFAVRLVAQPGSDDYSRLSVERAFRAEAEILERVPPGAFTPRPRVESAIVRLRPRPPPFDVRDEEAFHAVVLASFTQRRKKLAGGLRAASHLLPARLRGEDFASLPHAGRRPEEISPAEFAEVADALSNRASARARDVPLATDPDVYEPAEDSLLLADAVLGLDPPPRRVLDVGTGAGVAAIAAARRGAAVVATDVNARACALARANAEANGVSVAVVRGDLASAVRGPFDLVVFNAPYLPSEPAERLPGPIDHAFHGGEGGVEVASRLVADLPRLLAERGRALVVASSRGDLDALRDRALRAGFDVVEVADRRFFFERIVLLRLEPRR